MNSALLKPYFSLLFILVLYPVATLIPHDAVWEPIYMPGIETRTAVCESVTTTVMDIFMI